MNVVQVPRRFVRTDWGGTETVILETSKRLRAAGHTVTIVCPKALSDVASEEMDGVPVRRVPYFYPYFGLREKARRQLDRKGGNLFSFSLLNALLRQPGLDLIHLHTGKRVGGIGRHAAQRRGIPYVVSLHGGFLDVPAAEEASLTAPTKGTLEWGKALGWWVGSRRVLDDAAAIVCVGRAEREKVAARYPGKRVVHLPNGVDLRRFGKGDGRAFRARHGIPDDAFVILCVGRIDPQKNQGLLVSMMPSILTEAFRAHLVMVGPVTNEAYAEEVWDRIGQEDLRRRVTLIPGVDPAGADLVDAYHAADLFCLPSVHEPFGIVVLEAWAAGLPVVASAVGGVPSFVRHGRDGLLVPPGDGAALRRAVLDLYRQKDLRACLAQSGRQQAERFSWDRVTRDLQAVYEDARRENPVRA